MSVTDWNGMWINTFWDIMIFNAQQKFTVEVGFYTVSVLLSRIDNDIAVLSVCLSVTF